MRWARDRRSIARSGCLTAALVLVLGAAPARAAGQIAVAGLGVFAVGKGEDPAPMVDLELRWRPMKYGLRPVVGALASTDGAHYVRLGVGRDMPFAQRWNANLSLAAGGYVAGDDKNLGLGLEFRSAIDISFRLSEELRLGVALAHLSNAGFGNLNPGVEALSVTMAFVPRGGP